MYFEGTLFLIVGPSGVGKDTLMDGAQTTLSKSSQFKFCRRAITRPANSGGEDHIALTRTEFEGQLKNGKFLNSWQAHGLHYGIPIEILGDLKKGINIVLNTSRKEIETFQNLWDKVVPILITASPDVIEKRLQKRGRESTEEIKQRLNRNVECTAKEKTFLRIFNDVTMEAGIDALINVIVGASKLNLEVKKSPVDFSDRMVCLVHKANPIGAQLLVNTQRVSLEHNKDFIVTDLGYVEDKNFISIDQCALSNATMKALNVEQGDWIEIERSPSPQSRSLLQKKIQGGQLDETEIDLFVSDLVNGRYSSAEIAGFLVSASTNLTVDEVIHLTKVRAKYAHQQHWDSDVIVDKHSMGGIPGNRITPIITSIIAAYGLIMPKTSSRAITSAAGTADSMEVVAKVDLTPSEMKTVVDQTGACIAWNGHLTHSPVDDVMNSINRPLGLSSCLLDVSSIMSKKLAAGSTHVLIDMPVGPHAKTKSMQEAKDLADIFIAVGEGIGLKTKVNMPDGTKPIGHGIGPILEMRDVIDVLSSQPQAPKDLRDKAVNYAANILEWAGGVERGKGIALANELIDNGKAYEKFKSIVHHQGAQNQALTPGMFTYDFIAEKACQISEFNILALSSIARATGAPVDNAAGIDLLKNVGSSLTKGDVILRLHSSSQQGLDTAIECLKQHENFITLA